MLHCSLGNALRSLYFPSRPHHFKEYTHSYTLYYTDTTNLIFVCMFTFILCQSFSCFHSIWFHFKPSESLISILLVWNARMEGCGALWKFNCPLFCLEDGNNGCCVYINNLSVCTAHTFELYRVIKHRRYSETLFV